MAACRLTLGGFVTLYLILFMRFAPGVVEDPPIGGAELRRRAFGSCAVLMLTISLCIGPLARLDPRFLPLFYNRRHFGVATFVVAAARLRSVIGGHLAFSPLDPWVASLVSNADASLRGLPFDWSGMAALAILFAMAAISRDFWLAFLSPPVWKRLRMLVYACYGLVVRHAALGARQAVSLAVLPVVLFASQRVRCDGGHLLIDPIPPPTGTWMRPVALRETEAGDG